MHIDAVFIEGPEDTTYVPGQILTQTCSAYSIYPIYVIWNEPLQGVNKTDSRREYNSYNIIKSTISVEISLMTSVSFYIHCEFHTYMYIQPDNFTKVHGIFQKGLIFETPILEKNIYYSPDASITIQCKSNLLTL